MQSLFQQAIERASQGSGDGSGYQWYVYSYQAGYLLRRAAFILERLSELSTPPWPPACPPEKKCGWLAPIGFSAPQSWLSSGPSLAVLSFFIFARHEPLVMMQAMRQEQHSVLNN